MCWHKLWYESLDAQWSGGRGICTALVSAVVGWTIYALHCSADAGLQHYRHLHQWKACAYMHTAQDVVLALHNYEGTLEASTPSLMLFVPNATLL